MKTFLGILAIALISANAFASFSCEFGSINSGTNESSFDTVNFDQVEANAKGFKIKQITPDYSLVQFDQEGDSVILAQTDANGNIASYVSTIDLKGHLEVQVGDLARGYTVVVMCSPNEAAVEVQNPPSTDTNAGGDEMGGGEGGSSSTTGSEASPNN